MEDLVGIGRAQYEQLINQYFIPSQARLIMMAYRFSKYGHRGQERDSGGRYFEHPRAASLILLHQGILDHEVIIATLLHDVLEDSFILTWEDLEYIFNSEVCTLVKLVTKEPGLSKDIYWSRLAGGSPRAWLVKLADRLHNLSTLGDWTPERQIKKVKETRQKILPLTIALAIEPRYRSQAEWFKNRIEEFCQQYERAETRS